MSSIGNRAWNAADQLRIDDAAQLVRFIWIDNNGIARAKAITRHVLADRLKTGVGMAVCRQVANIFDRAQPVDGFGAQGEVRAVPDPTTYFPVLHAPGAGGVLCDLIDTDGTPWAACPRDFLRRIVDLAQVMGLTFVVAFEPEFTLFRPTETADLLQPADESLCFDIGGFDRTHAFAIDIIDALQRAGLQPEMYHPEYSPGQYELTVAPKLPIRAADEFAIYRMLVRGTAQKHDLGATFSAVPAPGLRGNGCHIHLSIWRDGQNVLMARDGAELSSLGRCFVAGLLTHGPALVALTCPSVVSYERMRPGMWAGGNLCYGIDDREAFVRLANASGNSAAKDANLEFRACDGTINPYLALGAVIAAGLDGIRRELSPANLPEAEQRLPQNLSSAIKALRADHYLQDLMGSKLSTSYLAVKESDIVDSHLLDEYQRYILYTKTH